MSRGATILYFSRHCNNCADFLTRLCKHPDLDKNIVKAQTGKHRFPPYIKSVPTIQIPDPKAPGKAIIYEGDDAFAWLDDQTAMTPSNNNSLMDYDPLAMGGVFGGGAYAGLDDKEAIPNLTMANIGDPNSNGLGITVNEQSGQSSNLKEDEMTRRMELMQQQRDNDFAQTMQRVPHGQGPPPPM